MKIVDQKQRARPLGAQVVADRGAMPVDLLAAAVAEVQRSLAVAQAGQERGAALVAKHVGGWAPGFLEGVLDHARERGRDAAKEATGGGADLVDRIAAAFGVERRRSVLFCALLRYAWRQLVRRSRRCRVVVGLGRRRLMADGRGGGMTA